MSKEKVDIIQYDEPPLGSGERRLSASGRRISAVDDVFGELVEGGPNYRNVSL